MLMMVQESSTRGWAWRSQSSGAAWLVLVLSRWRRAATAAGNSGPGRPVSPPSEADTTAAPPTIASAKPHAHRVSLSLPHPLTCGPFEPTHS